MSISVLARHWQARSLLVIASCLLTLSAATAQTPSKSPDTDPINAQATVPPAVHRSAITTYRSAGDQSVGSWREANQTVNRIGGWRTYAKERAAEEVPSSPSNPPRSEGHVGHEMGKPR